MRYVCLLVLMLPILSAQDGAAIYKERCAKCHDMPAARVPSLATIKAMSGEAIFATLTSGSMKTEATGLSTLEIFALLGYIAPTDAKRAATTFTPTCKGESAFRVDPKAPQWDGWSPSLTNSRYQDAGGAKLAVADVAKLKLKWAFNLGDVTVARAQPVIVGGRVFVTSMTGAIFALDADSGCTRWGFQSGGGIRGGVTVGQANGSPAVFFSDGGATLYALNAQTGAQIWKVKPPTHFASTVTASPRFYKGVVYQPYASFEEALGADPKFTCCTFRGSVAAVDANTGKSLWQTYTIPDEAKPTHKSPTGVQQSGPSGAAVWSSPTIDEQAGVLYVATGDNYSDPATPTSDAILAMDLKTGELRWSKQLTENDAFNTACSIPVPGNCPEAKGPDFDFGQPPILVSLGGGKRALVIGQKSGMAHAVDPDEKGKILWETRAGAGSPLGGSQWGSAADGQRVYVAISDVVIGGVADPKSPIGFRMVLDGKKGGGLHAFDLKTGKEVWSAKVTPCAEGRTDCSPAQSGAVTAIPGVVFSGAVDGHLRAYSASTGEVLWDTDTERDFDAVNGGKAHGGALDAAGPAVVNGMVFVNSGYGQWGGMPGNVLLAFSVDGK
ncbi:MAG TPA: PQQ-binding-like beta-propeller repeat protein [Bryobacteraceae bacterium]|nr:PQQ-binding-like beta-propeller repeat protein [Bryobacteraceae bacterium]